MVSVLKEKCVGCEACIPTCGFQALSMRDEVAAIDPEKCTGCGACVGACPAEAIVVAGSASVGSDDHAGVLVIGEHHAGQLLPITLELVGEGRKIADRLGCRLEVALLHEGLLCLVEDLRRYHVDAVLDVEAPRFRHYRSEAFSDAVVAIIRKRKPEVVLFGATENGRDLAPRVAATLHTGLTADCTTLEVDGTKRQLLQTRPAFGGNLMATIVCPSHRPQMATVRPGVMTRASQRASGLAEQESLAALLPAEDELSRVVAVVHATRKAAALGDAEIIVAGGRGVGGAAGFALLGNLADRLGATLGASRAAVEAGWIGKEHQVGQTGTSVRPRLYIACGISGAIQHLAGMQSSEFIISVNTNADAPITKVADLSIVGRFQDVLPKLIAEIEAKMR